MTREKLRQVIKTSLHENLREPITTADLADRVLESIELAETAEHRYIAEMKLRYS